VPYCSALTLKTLLFFVEKKIHSKPDPNVKRWYLKLISPDLFTSVGAVATYPKRWYLEYLRRLVPPTKAGLQSCESGA